MQVRESLRGRIGGQQHAQTNNHRGQDSARRSCGEVAEWIFNYDFHIFNAADRWSTANQCEIPVANDRTNEN